jgi:uncharacterized membrane protein YccC
VVSLEQSMTFRQAIKAGLASAIVLAITNVFRLEYPIYAVIAVVFVMESSLTGSVRAAYTRLLGTMMGTMLAAMTISIAGVNPLTLGLGVTLTICVCIHFKFTDALKLSAMLFGLVMLQHGGDPWSFAFHRLLDTSFGIVVAIAINLLIWPPRAWRSVHQNISACLAQVGSLYTLALRSYFTNSYDEHAIESARRTITALLRQNEQFWHDARHEPPSGLRLQDTWQYLVTRVWEDTVEIQHVAQEGADDQLWKQADAGLQALGGATGRAFAAIAAAVAGRQADFPSAELDQALHAAAESLQRLNELPAMAASMEEVARLFTLHHAMNGIAAKLTAMHASLEASQPVTNGVPAMLGRRSAPGNAAS